MQNYTNNLWNYFGIQISDPHCTHAFFYLIHQSCCLELIRIRIQPLVLFLIQLIFFDATKNYNGVPETLKTVVPLRAKLKGGGMSTKKYPHTNEVMC